MTAKKSEALPENLPEGLVLELYKTCWSVQIDGNLYVFPQETTKAQAEEVLRQAGHMFKTKMN